MAAVFTLTVRQLAGSRRIWLVIALVSLPLLAAVLFHVADSTSSAARFADRLTAALVVSTILPLVILLVATAAFGNEIGDRTLVYLALKPLARWRIVVAKLAGALAVGGVPVAIGAVLTVAIVQGGDAGGALATGAGVALGCAAYAAIFTWAGLATRHALIAGLVYVFVWEAVLARYLDGVRFLSVRRFTLAAIEGLDDSRLATLDNALAGSAGLAGAVIVIVAFTALAVRTLVRLDIP